MPLALDQIINAGLQIGSALAQPNAPKPRIDFAQIGNQLISAIDGTISAILNGQITNEQQRYATIRQIEDAFYAFQRLPQDKLWKSKDNSAFKTLESAILDKLNTLRNTSFTIIDVNSSGGLITNGQQSTSSTNNKTLIYAGIGLFAFFLLKDNG